MSKLFKSSRNSQHIPTSVTKKQTIQPVKTTEQVPANKSSLLGKQSRQGSASGSFQTNRMSFKADETSRKKSLINSNRQAFSSEITNYNAAEDNASYSQTPASHQLVRSNMQSFLQPSQSAALESFYLSSNVKVFIAVTDTLLNSDDSQFLVPSVRIGPDLQTVDLNFNEDLYKQYQFYHAADLSNENSNLFDFILRSTLDDDHSLPQVTTVMTYGQRSTGKSTILGTLFENAYQQYSLIQQALLNIFVNQVEECPQNEVYVSCYEVFLETLSDLFDETNEEFSTENEVTWLKMNNLQHAESQLKIAFLNRKQIVDENGLSYSQSHLIVNVKVCDSTSETQGRMISFIDLVGFDEAFTQKIMDGSSFALHDVSQLQRSHSNDVSDDKLQEVIGTCNDNNLYSLRNLLLAIENEQQEQIQQVLEETTLSRVVFAKLLQSGSFFVVGTVARGQTNFNESLNTLEFCTKIQSALHNQQTSKNIVVQQSAYNNRSLFSQQDMNLAPPTEEDDKLAKKTVGLPMELSAYLDFNPKQDQMSKFYNNQSMIHSTYFAGSNIKSTRLKKSSFIQHNRSNISTNSNKMLKFLDKFLHKQTYGESCLTSNKNETQFIVKRSKNIKQQKENPIMIQQDYMLDQSQNSSFLAQKIKDSNLGRVTMIKCPSQRSTGFATNTQLTHMRKYSQDLITGAHSQINIQASQQIQPKNVMKVFHQKNQSGNEKTFSELNFNESKFHPEVAGATYINLNTVGNFSKIVAVTGKNNHFDSSFLSNNFQFQKPQPYDQFKDQESIQVALNQFKAAKEQVAQQQMMRCKSQMSMSQKPPLAKKAAEAHKSSAAQFVFSVIQQSFKTLDVQMKDFNEFFVKEKSAMESCFVCKSSSTAQLPPGADFQDIFKNKKARFFDIDKVFKDIEQKELRQQTICSISSQSSNHKKNNKSINLVQKKTQGLLDQPQVIKDAKQQVRRGQSIIISGKENMQPPQIIGNTSREHAPGFQSISQLNHPLVTHTQQFTSSVDKGAFNKPDSKAFNELLNIMNNSCSVDVKRPPKNKQ